MPKLETLTKVKKFTKSNYRPWNFLQQIENEQNSSSTEESLAKQKQYVSNTTDDREQIPSNTLAINNIKKQTVSNETAQSLAIPLADHEQSVSKILENQLDYLTGKERKLVNYLFKKCQTSASLETSPITTDELKNFLLISSDHLRNLIFRVSKKNIITIKSLKNGRYGWRKFELNKDIFQQMSLYESVNNSLSFHEQSVSKQIAQPLAESLALPSSSSSNIKNTTTMTQEGLPDEWQEIDISPLAEFNFHPGHLKQLFKHQCELEMVEKSIEYFAFDLTENQKHKNIQTDPINFFMGIMKRAGVYNAPPNYVDPRVKAKKQFLEQQAKQAEDLLAAEKELFEQYFLLWSEKLPKEEREMIIGNDLMSRSSSFQAIKMRDYYRDNFWREHYQKIQRGES